MIDIKYISSHFRLLFSLVCLAASTLLMTPPLYAADELEAVNYDWSPFSALQASENIQLVIRHGDEHAVTGRAIDGDIGRLVVKQFGHWLVFQRNARWGIFPNGRRDTLEVVVTLPTLSEVKALDGAVVTVERAVLPKLRAEVRKDARLNMIDVEVADLTLVSRGGGVLFASGQCEQLTLSQESAGFINHEELVCSEVTSSE